MENWGRVPTTQVSHITAIATWRKLPFPKISRGNGDFLMSSTCPQLDGIILLINTPPEWLIFRLNRMLCRHDKMNQRAVDMGGYQSTLKKYSQQQNRNHKYPTYCLLLVTVHHLAGRPLCLLAIGELFIVNSEFMEHLKGFLTSLLGTISTLSLNDLSTVHCGGGWRG